MESTITIPRMRTIRQTADETGFAYCNIMQLCKQNKIVHVKAGTKYLVNFDKFIDYLNTGDKEQDVG
ncbi:DNA-binding protein [Acetobacterium sp.]|uniref:DNA-binding protein n=1 Tax=Acetobacterium sp. TaxID=1872094 RepID=UPI002F411EE8